MQVLCDFSGFKEKRCGPEKSVQKCSVCSLSAWLCPVFGFRLCCNELWTSWLGLKCLVATDGERTDHAFLQKGKIDQSVAMFYWEMQLTNVYEFIGFIKSPD